MPMKSQKTSQNSGSLMLLVNTAEDGERTGLLFLKDALCDIQSECTYSRNRDDNMKELH